MMRRTTAWTVFGLTVAVLGVLFLWPVLRVVGGGFFVDGTLTFDYLAGVFRNPIYTEGLLNSFMLGAGTTTLAILIALPLAWLANRYDFPGKTLGVWFFGNEYPFLSWMSQLGISTEGGEDGVEVLQQGFNVDPLLQRQADCISTMTYNEYWQVIDAGVTADELITYPYEDQGVATLEDGLYVLEERLDDPEFVDQMARFVRASMRGWQWAVENPEDAAMIVLDYDETGAQTETHQVRMMGEVAELVAGSDGTLDVEAYERTVATLLAGGSDPVITAEPEGAWTHAITDAALGE